MADKKQTIILKHGTAAPTTPANFKQGELLVRHATASTDTELYTRIDENNKATFVAFPSKNYVDAQINPLQTNLSTLISKDTNKSVRTIANEELAKQLLEGNDNFKSLQELAAWLDEHPDSGITMNTNIQELQKTLTGFTSASGNTVSAKTESIEGKLNQLQTDFNNRDTNFIKKLKVYKFNSNSIVAEEVSGSTVDLTEMVIDCGEY